MKKVDKITTNKAYQDTKSPKEES